AAERLLRDVSAALGRRGALGPAAQTRITLGRLLLERGRAVTAEALFGEAAADALKDEETALAMEARVWQALARTDACQLSAAEALCRAVLVSDTLEPSRCAHARAALARVLLWQDRVDEAAALDLSWPGD